MAEDLDYVATRRWAPILDGISIAAFVIDRQHRVTHWNKALESISGYSAEYMIGTSNHWQAFYEEARPCMADLIVDAVAEGNVEQYYAANAWRTSKLLDGAYEAEGFFHKAGPSGMWLFFTAAPLYSADGQLLGAIETLQDISERRYAEEELKEYRFHLEDLIEQRTEQLSKANAELQDTNRKLEEAHNQLLQAEKLASIGELAAGVAHEINNPIGFVNSNLGSLEKYVGSLYAVVEAYDAGQDRQAVAALKRDVDYDFIREDIGQLIGESRTGLGRVKAIVQALRDFSHVGNTDWQLADLHAGLDSVLAVLHAELGSREVIKDYGSLPAVECQPLDINLVFLNILTNAAQAMDAAGKIRIRTGTQGDKVWIDIADNGCGIPPENLKRVFDPFFTTKPVGSGTGLGLSLAYSSVKKHGGHIEVKSEVGRGTVFRIWLPVRQELPGTVAVQA